MPDDTATGMNQAPQFRFERFVVRRASFDEIERAPVAEGATRPDRVNIGIGIQVKIQAIQDPMRSLVTLEVTFSPDPQWQPYRIEVSVAGAFGVTHATFEQFDVFCRTNAPVILFPFVRDIAHRLTTDAQYGSLVVDPINIAALLNQQPWQGDLPTQADEPNTK